MHVLLIIEGTYPWYRGGVSEWVYQYLNYLSGFKFTILQIATDEFQGLNPSDALYPLTKNIEQFIRISPPEFPGKWEHYCEDWYRDNYPALEDLASDIQLIHVTNTGFAGWLGGRISEACKIPLLLTEHAIYWKEVEMGAVALECGYKIPGKENEKKSVVTAFKELAKYTYAHAQKIVTVSESNIPFQKDLGAENITYIPNGIPKSWLISRKKSLENPVIGWVGRCAEMKNPLAYFGLVESFRGKDTTPVFRMLLSDANEKTLEREVKETAAAYPEVDCIWNEQAKPYFKDFDFLVITSHNESQPLVMLEALANKALPVGFRVGDLTSRYGLVFEKQASWESVVNEIEYLWHNSTELEKYVDDRFKLVKDKHTWEHIFEDYEQLMMSINEEEAVSK